MFNIIHRRSMRVRLGLLVGSFLVGFLAFAGLAIHVLHTAKVNGPIYREIVLANELVTDVLPPPQNAMEAYLLVFEMLDEPDRDSLGTADRAQQSSCGRGSKSGMRTGCEPCPTAS